MPNPIRIQLSQLGRRIYLISGATGLGCFVCWGLLIQFWPFESNLSTINHSMILSVVFYGGVICLFKAGFASPLALEFGNHLTIEYPFRNKKLSWSQIQYINFDCTDNPIRNWFFGKGYGWKLRIRLLNERKSLDFVSQSNTVLGSKCVVDAKQFVKNQEKAPIEPASEPENSKATGNSFTKGLRNTSRWVAESFSDEMDDYRIVLLLLLPWMVVFGSFVYVLDKWQPEPRNSKQSTRRVLRQDHDEDFQSSFDFRNQFLKQEQLRKEREAANDKFTILIVTILTSAIAALLVGLAFLLKTKKDSADAKNSRKDGPGSDKWIARIRNRKPNREN